MTNINEALAKRKTHYFDDEWAPTPLCGLSPEVPRYGMLNYTDKSSEVTCKRCIRSLTGSYNR